MVMAEGTIWRNVGTTAEGEDAIHKGPVIGGGVLERDEEGKIWIRVIGCLTECHEDNGIGSRGAGEMGGKVGVDKVDKDRRRK